MEVGRIPNMDGMQLDILLNNREQKTKFFKAGMMEFLQLSRNLPQVEPGIVKEFFKNFDPKTGTSVVEGKTIKVTDELVRHVLHLPISDIAVEGETDPQFDPSEIFNNGDKALERGQGWRIADAKTPELREWFRFVQKRLVMKLSPTYLAQKLLVATLGTLESMLLNWAGYVSQRIHIEIAEKLKKGKVTTLLCSNYLSMIIRYQGVEIQSPLCRNTIDLLLVPSRCPASAQNVPSC